MAVTTNNDRVKVRDWTQGSIIQNILLLSWPMIVLYALYAVNIVLELVWVGRLGADSIAGVGVAGFIVILVASFHSGFGSGTRAMVARFVGGGDLGMANHVVSQAFIISCVYGTIIMIVGIFFTGPILSLFGLEPGAATEGALYLHIVLIGWITEAFWITAFVVMQASGDSLTPMKVAIVIRVVNAALCPFLVLGWWIFPRLGVSGAGFTYIIATGLGMLICFWILFSGKSRLRLTFRDFFPDLKTIWRILKIGIPASIAGMGKSFGDLILTWFVVPFGTLPLAGHNIISRIESFIFTPAQGFGIGASTLVGQNLGAGQAKQAARSGWLAMGAALGFMMVCMTGVLVWSSSIIGIFTSEPDLVQVGSTFLKIAAAGYLGMSAVYVLQYCIAGSGDTLPPMIISLAMLWVIQLPLALLLSRYVGLGVYGVRWAIVVGLVIGAIAYITYFWQGRWKRKSI